MIDLDDKILDEWELTHRGYHETLEKNPLGHFYTRDTKDERILSLISALRQKDKFISQLVQKLKDAESEPVYKITQAQLQNPLVIMYINEIEKLAHKPEGK